jgi:hypothetical protein
MTFKRPTSCAPPRQTFISFSVTFLMVKTNFLWRLLVPLSQTIGTLFRASLVCCDSGKESTESFE